MLHWPDLDFTSLVMSLVSEVGSGKVVLAKFDGFDSLASCTLAWWKINSTAKL